MKPLLRFLLCLLGPVVPWAGAEDGTVVIISGKGMAGPGLGIITSVTSPVLNNSGKVAFGAFSGDNQAIYLATGTSLQTIVTDVGMNAPGIGGLFRSFSEPLLNESGAVAFSGENTDNKEGLYFSTGGVLNTVAATGATVPSFNNFSKMSFSDTRIVGFQGDVGPVGGTATSWGLYDGSSGPLATLATTTQSAPGTGGNFSNFSVPAVNEVGVVAFQQTSTNGQQGLYTSHGSTLTTIITTQKSAPIPGQNVSFTSFGAKPVLNDRGTVAFLGYTGAAGSAPQGIFVGSGGAVTAIATTSDFVPGLGVKFRKFYDPAFNNSGTAAFRGDDVSLDLIGIYSGNGGALRTIYKSTQTAPHLSGAVTSLSNPSINSGGTVAFQALTDTGAAIYLGDGQELITVAYTGQAMSGTTVSSLNFTGGSDRGGASQFNDHGQVAYNATLLAGNTSTVQLFTPTLHYRTTASGTWANRANWTVSLQPAAVHDVVIDPTSSLTVTGPTLPVTVKSLTVNGQGTATASLALQKSGVLTVTDSLTVGAKGTLTGTGKIKGRVVSSGSFAAAAGTALTLSGEITGASVSTTGPGTVNLEGAQNYAALNALAGTTNVQGSFTGGTATVTAQATLNFGSSQTLSALNIGAGGVVTLLASGPVAGATPTATVVPEPGTVALLASWSLLILWRVRRVRARR